MLPDRLSRMLTAYVDGELNSQQQEAVLELLRGSDEARALLRQLQDDANQVRDLPAHKLNPDFTERVLEQVGRRPVRPLIRYDHPAVATQLHIGIGLATAAAMLLVVGLGSYYFLQKGQGQQAPPEPHGAFAKAIPQGPLAHDPVTVADKKSPSDARQPSDTRPADPPRPRDTSLEEKPTDNRPQPGPPASSADALTTPNEGTGTPSIHSAAIQESLNLRPHELKREDMQQRLLDKLHRGRTQRLEFECRQTAPGMKMLMEALEAQGIGLLVDKRAARELQAYDLGLPSRMDYAIYTENVTAEEILKIVQKIGQERIVASHRRLPLFNGLSVNVPTDKEVKDLTKFLGFNPLQPQPSRSGKLDPHKPLAEATIDQVLESLKGQRNSRPEASRAGGHLPDRLAIVVACTTHGSPADSREIGLFRDHRQELQNGRLQVLFLVCGPN